MKSKSLLPLMEQLIMILVFALTSVLCLQGFAAANRMSRRQESTGRAVVLAQNAAEILKYTTGDFEQAAELLGGQIESGIWEIYYDINAHVTSVKDDAAYLLQATPSADNDPFLGSSHIRVFSEEELLFEIKVAWQEVS